MDLETISKILFDIAYKVNLTIPKLRWYLFGSFSKGGKSANDIDILIVYNNEFEPSRIKKNLQDFMSEYPIHLVLMTDNEERELYFISRKNATQFFP